MFFIYYLCAIEGTDFDLKNSKSKKNFFVLNFISFLDVSNISVIIRWVESNSISMTKVGAVSRMILS